MPAEKIFLLYDGDCPICARYSRYAALRSRYDLTTVDARQDESMVRTFRDQGYDINDGVILRVGDRVYQGDGAIVKLYGLSARLGVMDWLTGVLLGTPGFLAVSYPVIKVGRWLLLKALGRSANISH